MQTLYIFSVWLHILAAMFWLGGMLFLVIVALPVLRRQQSVQQTGALLHLFGERFRDAGWVALTLLVLSGVFNLAYRGFDWGDLFTGRLWAGPFGRALAYKLTLVGIAFVSSAIHDFWLGPKATRWMADSSAPPEGVRQLRRRVVWLARLNLVLALAIVALAVILVRGGLP